MPQVFYCFGCQKGWEDEGGREGVIGAAAGEWGLGKHEIDRSETKERKRRTNVDIEEQKFPSGGDGKGRRPVMAGKEGNMCTGSACLGVLMGEVISGITPRLDQRL